MPDPIKSLGNGHDRVKQPAPGQLAQPVSVIPMIGVADTTLGRRVMVRLETPTGMHIVFLDAATAEIVAQALRDAATQVRTGLSIPKQT